MVVTKIFVDTLFVVALINQHDQYNQLASELADSLETHPLITTDAVLLEIGNALGRNYKHEAVEIIEHFFASDEVEIVRLTPELFAEAFALYKTYQDKTWGLVASLSVCSYEASRSHSSFNFRSTFCTSRFSGFDEINWGLSWMEAQKQSSSKSC
jgi:uncharacterized protein